MEERQELIIKFQKMLEKIDFEIPNHTSSKYYLNLMQEMILEGVTTVFENNRVSILNNDHQIPNGILEIEVFFGVKAGLVFKIKNIRDHTDIEMQHIIEVTSVRKGVLSEREELCFTEDDEYARFVFLREYDKDGICFYHSSRDLVKKVVASARLYDKGILLTQRDIRSNASKSIVLIDKNVKEKKQELSNAIKSGRIFEEIDNTNGLKVPYRIYPYTVEEFDKLLGRI